MPTVTIAASPIAGDIVCEFSELRGQQSSVAPVKAADVAGLVPS